MSHTDPAAAMLDAMTDIANAVAAYTGIKQQYIDHGWTPAAAEHMVIEMLRTANRNTY